MEASGANLAPRLKGGYDISDMGPGEEGPTVPISIRLPDDEAHLKALADKLAEYEARNSGEEYRPPGSTRPVERYKEIVLGRLLVEGEVQTGSLMADLSEEPGFDSGELEEAVRVIYDYATSGGQKNRGGTGLSLPR